MIFMIFLGALRFPEEPPISGGEAAYMYVTEVLEVSPQQIIPVWLFLERAAANSDDAMVRPFISLSER
jgi:hypothetical protein